ncbi:tetratricopeptide repeat protein [Faecalibacterium prausnitzii]|jgi:tetratricopeptide (TPR) repeat protein|uniref:tetratricopeptide repeat protein n=1 Tax=Faecalibacterium TaxID=216851 RepID=UPI0012DFAA35|nr:tetratricopeptide repeat protein [Faecalibacterium prausnitzii]HJI03850.1 tetratricopeptide repeat protein [Faecalibacterium prausnitzii]
MIARRRKLWSQLIAVIVLVAVLLTSCGSKAATATDKIELGQKYLTELNYTEAIASFTEAIKLDPNNIQAYMGRAEAYVALGEYDKALADYRFISGTTEDMPYTRALSYIGQAEVHEKMEQPARAVSDYGLAKALLKASDAGKAENVSEEDVSAKLVQVLYVHAALCETLTNYNAALEDYNDLLELGENTAAKRDEVLSQLGETAEDENGLTDAEEPAAESTAEEPAEEPTEESAPGQEAASESESQSAKEETKQEEPASSSEQAADTEEAAASQEKASTQPEEEKTNWVTYTETKTSFMGSNCILHVKYGIGEKNITVQETEDAEDDRVESKTIYHLSVPLQSAKRVEKGYDGHVIFYVPEGTTITMSYSYQDGKYSNRADPCTFNWIETNRVMSDSEVENANVACAESVTIQKGTMYQMVNGTVDGWISDIGGVVFCAK